MMWSTLPFAAALLCASLCTTAFVGAQAASSKTFFLPANEHGAGGQASSTRFRLSGSFDSGAIAQRAASRSFVLNGGFVASHDVRVSGRPWLTGVRPLYAPLKGGTTLTLYGTELHLGLTATLKIGAQVAAVTTRTRDQVQATLPLQPEPGWQAVELNAGGVTTTLPRGLGVLPMLDLDRPRRNGRPFEVSYRGKTGDLVVWLVGAARGPKIVLPGYGHGFELNLAAFHVLTGTIVSDPSGVQRLALPGVNSGPLYFQSLVISRDAGYAPGSFTNTTRA